MGRTNPTYRRYIDSFEDDWSEFRRALRHQYQSDWDRLFAKANFFADAGGYQNAANPETTILLSIILAQEVELRKLREAVDLDESELPLEMQRDESSDRTSNQL